MHLGGTAAAASSKQLRAGRNNISYSVPSDPTPPPPHTVVRIVAVQ
jgi:hypothetical protein